jgi:hypothetical protein
MLPIFYANEDKEKVLKTIAEKNFVQSEQNTTKGKQSMGYIFRGRLIEVIKNFKPANMNKCTTHNGELRTIFWMNNQFNE